MRVTSSVWVAALIRRVNAGGASAILQRRGADEAGAVFVIVDTLGGTANLYAPAPQAAFDEARPSDRKFQKVVAAGSHADIAERLDREKRFDADLWIVVIEDREGREWFETV